MVVLLNGIFWSEHFHHDPRNELLHVLNGQMTIEYADGRSFPLQTGDVLLIPPDTEHRDVFHHDSELKLQLIHFDLAGDNTFFSVIKPEKLKNLFDDTRNEIKYLLSRIRNDLSSSSVDMLINEYRLNTILQLICRELLEKENDELLRQKALQHTAALVRNPAKLGAAARHYVECNYCKPISLSSAAKHFHVSSCYFSHLFRQENGESFIAFLTDLRLREAERLLRDSAMNVSEVARSVGYENANYFARLFQRRHGFPPSDYREKTFTYVKRQK